MTRPPTESGRARHSIHVACLPYPSLQGTQAWLKMSLNALVAANERATLLCYASGDQTLPHGDFEVVRVPGTSSSLHSGPSAGKLRADIRMVPALRALANAYRSATIVAHNVEAAWICRLALRRRRWIYVAHTRMDEELPTYHAFPGLRVVGRLLDHVATTTRDRAAVSPMLAAYTRAIYLPVPWKLGAVATTSSSRAGDAPRAVYAGNLDGYQDIPALAAAHACGYRLIVATSSDTTRLGDLEVEAVLPIRTESDRERVYAMADIALVPRLAAGGLPMKLLDALARGVPVAATERALAGLRPAGVCSGSTLHAALEAHRRTPADGHAGRQWIAEKMSSNRFIDAFSRIRSGVTVDQWL